MTRRKKRKRKKRGARRRPVRRPGYAGMPRAEWTDWRQVAETFVAERPSAAAAENVEVLVLVLRLAKSWADLVGGGTWLQFAGVEVYTHYVEGFDDARTYRLIERFVRWLHGRGDLTDWQRDVLVAESEERRAGRAGGAGVRECRLGRFDRARLAEELAAAVGDPSLRADVIVDLLVGHVEGQLGPSDEPPMGSLDPDLVVADVMGWAVEEPGVDAAPGLLSTFATLYRLLGESERLDPARANAIAARFAMAALTARRGGARPGSHPSSA